MRYAPVPRMRGRAPPSPPPSPRSQPDHLPVGPPEAVRRLGVRVHGQVAPLRRQRPPGPPVRDGRPPVPGGVESRGPRPVRGRVRPRHGLAFLLQGRPPTRTPYPAAALFRSPPAVRRLGLPLAGLDPA